MPEIIYRLSVVFAAARAASAPHAPRHRLPDAPSADDRSRWVSSLCRVAMRSSLWRVVALCCVVGAGTTGSVWGQAADTISVSFIYTGGSLGALGKLRAQGEHELLTEEAVARGLPFRLVSHLAWRYPGLAAFQPSSAPVGDELPAILASRDTIERIDSVPALRSDNVLIVQDPWREGADLLAMIERNPRTALMYPDLRRTVVSMSRMRTERGRRVMIVEEEGSVWEGDAAAWHEGEMNRVDVGDTRIFELPINLGEIGPRQTLLNEMLSAAKDAGTDAIVVDLGERGGDLGMTPEDRARLDYATLSEMGYRFVVPYEFELSLGSTRLAAVRDEFPAVRFLAANVQVADSTLFAPTAVVVAGGIRIGVLGLVDPATRDQLPRSTLDDYTFAPLIESAQRAVDSLRMARVSAVVALSNLDPADNARIAEEVTGIDAVVADLHERWSVDALRTTVDRAPGPARPGSPALVARGTANGLAVGHLELAFERVEGAALPRLMSVAHSERPVTDRIPSDTAFLASVTALARVTRPERGELMFPSFVELADRHPELRDHDETTRQGRMSKELWEEFLSRLVRVRSRAEVAILRPLSHFPPLIGKLHENEIGAWLWVEDEIIVMDLTGADLRKVMEEDTDGELSASGIDPDTWTVLGRPIEDGVYYRVATTDVLYDGARFHAFGNGKRVRRRFRIEPDGRLAPTRDGATLTVKDFAFGELRRLRASARGDEYLDLMAALLVPDPAYVSLVALRFDQPTVWISLNQNRNSGGYGSVRESRVVSNNSWVVGLSGRLELSRNTRNFTTMLGLDVAYARQSQTLPSGEKQSNESADDLEVDLTVHPRALGRRSGGLRPFLRGVYDTEFTATADPVSGSVNPHQRALRGVGGVLVLPQRYWRRVEVAGVVQNDFGQPNVQLGVQARVELYRPLGPGGMVYRWRNDATYLFPSSRDTESDLALRYHMVHELLLPLVDELTLSVAADFFFYQGKVDTTRDLGMSFLLRVGITYNRLWKPRYQPLF
jgi:2',3'-cyclic-nucleotide 2'-phosphodiesterase (5'-nucleotidase family)